MKRGWWMVLAFGVAAATACNPGPNGTFPFDAPASFDGRYTPPACNPPGPLCSSLCGNNQVDNCWTPQFPGGNHCSYYPTQEQCDGTPVGSCADRGYYGGALGCTACRIDDSTCEACPPSTACGTYAPLQVTIQFDLAVSGARVALGGDLDVAVFEGMTEITRTSNPYGSSIAAVPNGWLVASTDPAALTPFDLAGTAGTSKPLPESAVLARLASGPTGRVLAAWKEAVSDWHVYYAIFDTDGNMVVQPTDLMVVDGNSGVATASDGTNFFVGSKGTLARIAPDGTATLVTGFPMPQSTTANDDVRVTWSGTTGWYISGDLVVQRFAASGALVGSAIPMNLGGSALDFAADGNDLLVLRGTSTIDVLRMNTSGVFLSVTPVGGGAQWGGQLARLGNNLFVAWLRLQHLQVALVAP